MAIVYLSLGGNMGDREKFLAEARKAIEESFSLSRFSGIYETEPVDFLDQPWFLNQVAEIQTDLTPESLLEWAHLWKAVWDGKETFRRGLERLISTSFSTTTKS